MTTDFVSEFLMLVDSTSDGIETLQQQETSDFGYKYHEGAQVIKGNYLEYKKSSRKDLNVTRDRKNAMVPLALSLIYCALDVSFGNEQNQYILSNEGHT